MKPFYFYCLPVGRPEDAAFQHAPLCLAEGLKQLGIPYHCNVNYWRTAPASDDYALNCAPEVQTDDCSVVVVGHEWLEAGKRLPENLFRRGRNYLTVYIDHADGAFTRTWSPEVRQFDLVFKAHFNARMKYPSNCHVSWPFGLSNRIIQATEGGRPFADRTQEILFNFRVNHSLRQTAKREFIPRFRGLLSVNDRTEALPSAPTDAADQLNWVQTGRRHHPAYFDRLKQSMASAAFCGFFAPPWPLDQHPLTSRLGTGVFRRLDTVLKHLRARPSRLVQWDSWRLWESLAAGCATFHADFDKYGVRLPAMPENWKHYVGIDFDNLEGAVERIRSQPFLLESIATEGRRWVLQHYSPMATARRFLETINMTKNTR